MKKFFFIVFIFNLITGCVSTKPAIKSKQPANLQVWLSPYTDSAGNRHTAQVVEVPLEEKNARV